jgi:nucleoid-associated protein YgaU
MSRDAKVGLVIIFTFVFLLGTIVLHRYRVANGASDSALKEPVVSESDPDTPDELLNNYPVGDSQVSHVAVDARPEELPSTNTVGSMSRDPAFDTARHTRKPNLSRPPSELPASNADGALISLTDGEAEQPAAIVESAATANSRPLGMEARRRLDSVPNRDVSSHSKPLLDIHASGNDASHEEQHANEKTSTTVADATSSEIDEGITGTEDAKDQEMATVAEGSDSELRDDRQSAQMLHSSRSKSNSLQEDVDEGSEADVRQAESRQGLAGYEQAPPRLPRFGDSHQATIESVAPPHSIEDRHDSANTSNTRTFASRSTLGNADDIDESVLDAQRTYVIKEGDSFWSISAKQYGTGKYFRALEEFNAHRLAAHEDGRRILRPGTEILLPDPSALRSKSTPAKKGSPALPPSSGARDGFKASQTPIEPPGRMTNGTRLARNSSVDDRRNAADSRTYRVQEGDTLSVIAQRELGSSKRWQEIYELNRDQLDDKQTIKIGMELKLPAAESAEKLFDRPRDGR